MESTMTDEEIQIEVRYRYEERLALLCPVGVPSAVEESLASADARAWLLKTLPLRVMWPNDPKLSHGHGRLAHDCNLDFQIS